MTNRRLKLALAVALLVDVLLLVMLVRRPQPAPLVWFEVVADDGVILVDLLAQSDVPAERLAAAWVERYGVKGDFQVLPKPRR